MIVAVTEWLKIFLPAAVAVLLMRYLYRRFHGTRGGAVLFGAAVLLGMPAVCAWLLKPEQSGVFWRAAWPFLTIALIVVFQPELRRLFTGSGELIFRSGNSNRRFVIEHIVRSVAALQEKNCGALIAVERTAVNHPTHESGVPVDGKVTEELLTTIFTDKTPLHDGGVSVRGDRLIAAGCIFPLTMRQDLDRNLGLRHRAALGFSEETDAVVVVLSEERGEISLARKGVLERGLTHDALRQRLTELLLPKKTAPEKAATNIV